MLFKSQSTISKEAIEKLIEDKVTDILAARALDQPSIAPQPEISDEVQKRLELLEQKIDGKDSGREQGLTFLLMAKQHAVRGEDTSALRMYTLSKNFFPGNKKLDLKIDNLREKIQQRKPEQQQREPVAATSEHDSKYSRHLVCSDYGTDKTLLLGHRPSKPSSPPGQKDSGVQAGQADARLFSKNSALDTVAKFPSAKQDDNDYETEAHDEDDDYESDGGFRYKAKTKKKKSRSQSLHDQVQTPRTKQLLDIVNARDIKQIKLLRGVGSKRAEAIVEALCGAHEDESSGALVKSLSELGRLRGVGPKTVERMRMGLQLTHVFE